MPVEDYPLPPVALAARRILAALDSHECPQCHLDGAHKMSCSRGGSKGARACASLREGGEGCPPEPPTPIARGSRAGAAATSARGAPATRRCDGPVRITVASAR